MDPITDYVGTQISNCRRDTKNTDTYSATNQTGISDEDFLRYLNHAQEKLFGIIVKAKPKSYVQSQVFTGLTETDGFYTLTDNVYLADSILHVMVSPTGETKDYREIRERAISYFDYNNYGSVIWPSFYARQNGRIGLSPLQNNASGKMKVWYRRMLDRLDTRRGTVTARTLSSTQLTALTLDTASDDATALATARYLCVNDSDGVVKMYNIPITSYNATTGVVTLPAFTFASGETVAVGDYVTIGQFTTTHSKLRREVLRYLEAYCCVKISGPRDSSDDVNEWKSEMKAIEEEIDQSYKNMDQDEIDFSLDECYMLDG